MYLSEIVDALGQSGRWGVNTQPPLSVVLTALEPVKDQLLAIEVEGAYLRLQLNDKTCPLLDAIQLTATLSPDCVSENDDWIEFWWD